MSLRKVDICDNLVYIRKEAYGSRVVKCNSLKPGAKLFAWAEEGFDFLYYSRMENCLFCKIASHEIPADILYEDSQIMVFRDISPQAPVHFLIIPKKHIDNIMETKEGDKELLGHILFCAQKIAKSEGCEDKGARFVLNCKTDGGQTVNHLHLHVLGKRMLYWPPG